MVDTTSRTLSRSINEMSTMISLKLGPNKMTISDCEENGLKLFDPFFYKKLNLLGKGSFGEVWRCLEITKRVLMAVKYLKIKDVASQEKMIENIASFLVEKSIMERISSEQCEMLPTYFGSYYAIDEKGDVEHLILISEAGDFNLEQLLLTRKEVKNCESGYEPEEALNFIIHISEGYEKLQDLGIYHSDTKLANLVFSKEKKGFIIIDFGVSKAIPFNEHSEEATLLNGSSIIEFATGGTKEYNSKEKDLMWKCLQEDEELAEKDSLFDPFKCDMWALAVCIEKMVGGNPEKIQNQSLRNVLGGLKNENWRERLDSKELRRMIKEDGLDNHYDPAKIAAQEEEYILILDEKRRKSEGFEALYNRLGSAFMPQEQVKVAEQEYQSLVDNFGSINNENGIHFVNVLRRLGLAHKKNGNFIKARENFQKQYDILMQVHKNLNNEVAAALFNIARVEMKFGKLEDALENLEKVKEIRMKVFKTDEHADVLEVLSEIALIKGKRDQRQEAIKDYERILGTLSLDPEGSRKSLTSYFKKAIQKKLYKTENNLKISYTLSRTAVQWQHAGNSQKALAIYENVLEIQKRILKTEENVDVSDTMSAIAFQWQQLGDYKKALDIYNRVLEIRKALYKTEDHKSVVDTLSSIARQIGKLGDRKGALGQYEKLLEIQKRIFQSEEIPDVALTYHQIAYQLQELGEFKKALQFYEKALEIRTNLFKTKQHSDVVLTLGQIAYIWGKLGEKEKALSTFYEVLEIRKRIFKTEDHPSIATTFFMIANLYESNGENEKALENHKKALELRLKILKNKNHPDVELSKKKVDALTKKLKGK